MKIRIDNTGWPTHCPKCNNDDLTISCIDGMVCEDCGCWFDCEEDGSPLFLYFAEPLPI